MNNDPVFLDHADQVDIIHSLSEKLKSCYIFPDVAEKVCHRIQQYLMDGEYSQLTEGNLFALALTIHLLEVSHDEHLWVRWHSEALPDNEGQLHLDPEWQLDRQQEARLDNYGFFRLERLPGNIGYLDIRYFHRPAWGGEIASAALTALSNVEALIIDLRHCTGGFPGMVALICSYLFGDEPLHLVDIYWRDEDVTQQFWTQPFIPGSHFKDKPVYVLTSKITFSAGEMCADILQKFKRATIIGEKTDGGANAGASFRIHPHFEAFIPIGRTIDPSTGSNWEGCGITPDILVSDVESYNLAYKSALLSVLAGCDKSNSAPLQKLADEARVALKGLEEENNISHLADLT